MSANHHCLNASIPQHLYGYVNRLFLTGYDPEEELNYEPCVIFGVTSIPSRALHFSILCESGAQWARVPLHMLRWEIPRLPIPQTRRRIIARVVLVHPRSHGQRI